MPRNLLLICAAAIFAASCGSAQKSTSASTGAKSDPLVGKWVCLADNVNATPKETMEFLADGTVTMHDPGQKTITTKYKRQALKEWFEKRSAATNMSMKGSPFDIPNGELVTFADEKGNFADYGGAILMLDPKEEILTNPLTAIWCRPGDEARVRKLTGMDEQDKRRAAQDKQIAEWRPKVDISKQWTKRWSVDVSGDTRGRSNIAVGDVNGDGKPEAVVPDAEGFAIIDAAGKVLRNVHTSERTENNLALGRSNGKLLVASFSTWSEAFSAFDLDGRVAWTYTTSGSGIDWITSVELDATNTGFAIGYNGGGGIDLIGPDGKKRWNAPVDANAWNVASTRLERVGPEAIVSVDRSGAVVFDDSGKRGRAFASRALGAVGSADLDGDGTDEVLTLGTTISSGLNVTAFKSSGAQLWSHKASDSGTALLEGSPFVCGRFGNHRLLGVADHSAIRFFESDGSLFGDMLVPGSLEAVATMSSGSKELLLVRIKGKLECFEMK